MHIRNRIDSPCWTNTQQNKKEKMHNCAKMALFLPGHVEALKPWLLTERWARNENIDVGAKLDCSRASFSQRIVFTASHLLASVYKNPASMLIWRWAMHGDSTACKWHKGCGCASIFKSRRLLRRCEESFNSVSHYAAIFKSQRRHTARSVRVSCTAFRCLHRCTCMIDLFVSKFYLCKIYVEGVVKMQSPKPNIFAYRWRRTRHAHTADSLV